MSVQDKCPSPGQIAVPKQSEVVAEFAVLESTICELESMANTLINSLEPILREPEPQCESDKDAPAVPLVSVAHEIRCNRHRVQSVINRLRDAYSRVEV
jgi:hypothetical protein